MWNSAGLEFGEMRAKWRVDDDATATTADDDAATESGMC